LYGSAAQLLDKRDADPIWLTPDDSTLVSQSTARDSKLKAIGNTNWSDHFQICARVGEIANYTINNRFSVDYDLARSKFTLPGFFSTLVYRRSADYDARLEIP
jgi:hypothetical protein